MEESNPPPRLNSLSTPSLVPCFVIEQKLQTVLRLKGDGDSHSGLSTDEAFLSKGSSQEELEESKPVLVAEIGDSDG
jgi:hypothetical protein